MQILRRKLLASSLAGSAVYALAATAPLGLRAAAAAFEWLPLGEGLALAGGAGGAVLVSYGSDGTAMIDGGNAVTASALLQFVESRTGQPPELLFNTHCHREQTGCNDALGSAGATIVAHENTRLWLNTEYISQWENTTYPPLARHALPNRTFHYDTQTLQFNEPLEYAVLPQAHTDGDMYVFFPERNVLFAGDVVASGSYPLFDYSTNGWIGGMINGLDTLLGFVDESTRILAGNGAELRKPALQEQRDMLNTFIERIGAHVYRGSSLAEFIDTDPTAEFDVAWGNPALFIQTAWDSVFWGHIGDVRRFGR